jgi:hypothetical protein
MSGFLLSNQLRSALKREVTNDSALLEVLQQVAWAFQEDTTAGDALLDAISEIDDLLNVCDPTLENLAQLADYRRRSRNDEEAEAHFTTMNNFAKAVFGMRETA